MIKPATLLLSFSLVLAGVTPGPARAAERGAPENAGLSGPRKTEPGFDEAVYRRLRDKLVDQSDQPVARFPENFSSDEELAAYCAFLYAAYGKGGNKRVPLPVLSEGAARSQRLLEKHPASIELLTLRLGYGHVELEPRFSPFLEVAYPLVRAAEAGRIDGPWKEALIARWYWAFWNMAANYSEQEAQKRKGPGPRPLYPRRRYLFDPAAEAPTDEDVLMWRAVFAEGAARATADKDRWMSLLKSMESEPFKTGKRLSAEQARARLELLLTQYASMAMVGGDGEVSGRQSPAPPASAAPSGRAPDEDQIRNDG